MAYDITFSTLFGCYKAKNVCKIIMHELQTTPAMDDTVLPSINGGVFGESVHRGDQNGVDHGTRGCIPGIVNGYHVKNLSSNAYLVKSLIT